GRGAGSSRRQTRASSRRPGSLLESSWVMAGLLAAGVLLVFAPLVSAGFLDRDTPENLVRNPDMNPPTLASVARYWNPAHPHMDLYIPMTYTTWGLIGSVASGSAAIDPRNTGAAHLDPRVFHAANLL